MIPPFWCGFWHAQITQDHLLALQYTRVLISQFFIAKFEIFQQQLSRRTPPATEHRGQPIGASPPGASPPEPSELAIGSASADASPVAVPVHTDAAPLPASHATSAESGSLEPVLATSFIATIL